MVREKQSSSHEYDLGDLTSSLSSAFLLTLLSQCLIQVRVEHMLVHVLYLLIL